MGAYNVVDAGTSPHSPVRLILGGKLRQDAIRVLKVPKSHPAVMPFGPEIRSKVDGAIDSRSDADLGEDYDGCIAAI